MKKCKYCSKDFIPKNPKGVFCSDNCRVYFSRRKKKIKAKKAETPNDQKYKTEIIGHHNLWKQGDPAEGSNVFFLRFGAFTYDEIKKE